MNFGDKLKKLRTERGLTQPQFAEQLGIEQSYLSKLENDKSVPSADMFATILAGTGLDAATFLDGIDKQLLATTLRHIPAVSQFNTQAEAEQVHDHKKWLYGCGLAWLTGFAMMLAANDGIFFSNKIYRYESPGVILPGEADNIFDKQQEILSFQMMAKTITHEQFASRMADFKANRARPAIAETRTDRGGFYVEPARNGHRRFELVKTRHEEAPENRILQFLGAVVLASGFVGLFIEWRLRRIRTRQEKRP
ncbi:helix-turn-helix transcriptional regulator [Massilia sp. METH4]|uniref:helix-turn-helix domain-containing protein n=1 Tax=Massilia sp. METH4 TaxID=3123041 RepID=UPI0030CBF4E4